MNRSTCSGRPVLLRTIAPVALALVLAQSVTGCQTVQQMETTGSLGVAQRPQPEADRRRASEALGKRYRANTKDSEAAIKFAQALRASGERSRAVAVLEQASLDNPEHVGVLGAYGRALADTGSYQQALDVLSRAHKPEQPDWRILSTQGAVLDQMGRHDEAQRYYGTALRIAPDEPAVLSNLGLSYALAKDLVRAEATLRRAAGQARVDPQVRQNLAMILGLQGRRSEAAGLAPADLTSDKTGNKVAYLQQVMAQQNGWTQPGERAEPGTPARSAMGAQGT
jgi:Flp pilus assembly protein TadD